MRSPKAAAAVVLLLALANVFSSNALVGSGPQHDSLLFASMANEHQSAAAVEECEAIIIAPHTLNDDKKSKNSSNMSHSFSSIKTRRQFFLASASTTFFPTSAIAATDSASYFSLQNNNNIPNARRGGMQQKIQQQKLSEKRSAASSSFSKKWTPFVGVNKWKTVEKCLLELLPVKNGKLFKPWDLLLIASPTYI